METVKFLVENGAYTTLKDRFGATPLDDAIREGHPEIMEYLRVWTSRATKTTSFGNP